MIYTKIAFDNQKHVFIIAEAGSNWKSKNEKLDLIKYAQYIERATLPNELVLPLSAAPKKAPYFSMILVTKGNDPWL